MSDQDFFFDEDNAKPTEKPVAKSPTKAEPRTTSAAATSTPAQSAPSGGGDLPIFEQSVTIAVASLLMAVGLLVGVIIGFLLAGVVTPAPLPGSGTAVQTGAGVSGGTGGTAPQLTPEQATGKLPAGHVPVSGAAAATATP